MHWQLRDSMRERTPSADDTPKRAPPAPPREASSADVVGGRGTGAEASPIARFSSPTANNTMVASTHKLGELVLGQYRLNTSERQFPEKNHHHYHHYHHNQQHQQQQHQQHQHHHHYNHHYHNSNNNHNHHSFYNQYHHHQPATCRPGQTDKDKRSRLSNVINNLRRKVPETSSDSGQSDERNSVERDLETLEKYVMTVLNGVIKDAETEGRGRADVNGIDTEDSSRYNTNGTKEDVRIITESDCNNPAVNHEPSEPSAIEPAIPDCDKDVDKSATETIKMVDDTSENNIDEISSIIATKDFDIPLDIDDITLKHLNGDDTVMNIDSEFVITTNIGDKLNDNIRSICRDVLNDLLNDISQAIDTPTIEKVETNNDESITMTSLHCSLPLDKVAPVLTPLIESHETMSNAKIKIPPKSSPKSTTSPTVRHLCLYCDRKFLSISLRQRHTDRVHQLGGGRRSSERNSRKTLPSCQYCSDKCADNLEGLFQHMIACHTDKYHACTQCNTRYSTREALLLHTREFHTSCDRISESLDRSKELVVVKEPHYSTRDVFIQNTRDIIQQQQQEKSDDSDRRPHEHELLQPAITTSIKLNMYSRLPKKSKDISNPSSPDFDVSFYSSVSCNIRENLLHHLDGKLQNNISNSLSLPDPKPQQHNHQLFHESVNQTQLPIDISLTAATPVESKEYSTSDNCDNTSEYAQKAGKMSRLHPRRVSFEKYNFPRKYDGKEQWTCSINDLSKFDIYTQLTLSKKQEMIKDNNSSDRITQLASSAKSESGQTDLSMDTNEIETINVHLSGANDNVATNCLSDDDIKGDFNDNNKKTDITEFSGEFGNFMRLRRWDECSSGKTVNSDERVHAELTGEWSRPRVYICGACTSRHLTLKEMEEHKIFAHPNVWCSHLEFTGDQRELYKHLFLPGRSVPTMKAKNAVLHEKICTKCSKVCGTLAELHRHMLECGGDQAWLLGLFGNGKKKCKWRPFGSRSRRRRQRGMKRNISNSQGSPRVSTPKEKAPSGPRVRPSDRESIQKMLANLPAKRSTRRVIQEANSRCRLRKVQTRSRPHLTDNTTNTRLSRKTVLRNKLLKNAKSFQRKRCRGDNISAAIESVIINYKLSDASTRTEDKKKSNDNGINGNKELKIKRQLDNSKLRNATALNATKNVQSRKIMNRVRVVSKKRNVKMETRKSNLKSIEKNSTQITEEMSSSSSSSPSLSSTSTSPNNLNAKSVKVGLKRSTKDALNVANSQSKARANVPNAVSALSGDNITTRKRKSCDPLMSLNASIKAKSQLRSQDGKFIRNNLRNDSTRSDSSNISNQKGRTRTTRSDPGPLASRLRLRTAARSNAELSKRITRVSSDSDKMPTLEPVDGLMIGEEKDIEQPIIDLPILSPAILANRSCLKPSNNSTTKQNDIKTRGKRGNILPKKLDKFNKQNSNVELSTGEKDDVDIEPEVEMKNRKSLRRRVSNNVEVDDSSQRHESLRESKSRDDNSDVNRKSFKSEQLLASSNKKILTSKVAGTRKARQKRRAGSLEELSQLQQVPLEVKKLLGPKDDLFTQIGITPTAKIRRNLRQLSQTPKQKINITKKSNKLCDEDNNKDHISNVDTINDKCEKNILRKSPRIERKDSTSDGLSSKLIIADKINESKEYEPSLCNIDIDNQKTTIITTQNNVPGRSRRRGKLSDDSDNTNSTINLAPDFIEPTVAPTNCPPNYEENETEEDQEDDEAEEDFELAPEDKEVNSGNDIKNDDNVASKDILTVDSVSLSFEDLQQESSNSNIDSGKENSSETPVNISKPRITRPKKSRGLKRDRVVKRTLNNVIGILTEGVNIPVEVQQSVVLTVQTSIDNITSNNGLPNNRIEIGDNGIAASNGGGSNIDLIVNENNDDNCNTIHDSAVDDGKGESASQELQRCASPLIEAKEEAKLDVKQDVNIECSVSNVTTNNVVHIEQQPTNDIILDLSRRKPRGKGSFLEKIVSKIAKQKDALLEGEVGSLLDHAVDELSIILDEVGPTLVDATNDAPKLPIIVSDLNENKNDNIIVEEKLDPSNEIIEGTMKIDENLSSFNPEPFNNLLLELNSVNDVIPLESEQKSDNICNERNSKKRSLDISVETKNKRKSVEEEELEDNRIEEDLCLADIMKLINTAKRESPIVNESHSEKVRPGKRKISEKECDTNDDCKDNEETLSSLHVGNNCHINTTEINKKSKRSDDRKRDDKIDMRSEITRRSSSRRNKSDDNLLTEVADNKLCVGNNEIDENNPITNESHNESSTELATPSVENDLINIDCQVASAIIDKKSSKTKRRSKKKSIISEQLCLVVDKSVTERNVQSTESETSAQDDIKCTPVSDQASIQNELIEDVKQGQEATAEEDTSSSPKRAFKIPEVLDTPQTTKNRGRKKSLANEHLALADIKIVTAQTDSNQPRDSEDSQQDESILETSDVCNTSCDDTKEDKSTTSEAITVRRRRSSKRKNNEVDIISISVRSSKENKKLVEDNSKKTDETLIERRKTLKRKAKENIFLFDDVIDFGDDMDSPTPPPTPLPPPPPPESTEESITELCDQEINSEKSGNEIVTVENNCPLELQKNPPEDTIESELETPKSPIVDNAVEETENAITDDVGSAKKRGSGNFAVVHTKSGEILIVEKKKKFTKEQAKFFCDICTTSFTRKSSLKKHNQSQSHLIQVSKFGSDQEIQDESISIDDTTVSSVDRSEMTNSEDRQDTAVDTSNERTVEHKNENILEQKETEEEKKEEVECSSQSIQASPAVEKPATPIVDPTIGESTFNCPQLEEDFEDELLDEEICKITENMTHDEYVLTDHVSPLPEGTSLSPLKDPTDSLLESSQTVESEPQKTNLANEHLDLESPILDSQVIQADEIIAKELPESPKKNSPIISEYKYGHETYKNINVNSNESFKNRHETQKISSVDTKISLDFSNITEKLKINEFTTNNRKTPTEIDDFDSDEDLSATNMSRDIHKLLNETELNIDEKIVENKTIDDVDNVVDVPVPIQCENSLSNIEIEKQIIINEIKPIKKKKDRRVDSNHVDTSSRKSHRDIDSKEITTESNRKSSKSIEKSKISKSKSRISKSLKKKMTNEINSDSDDDDQEDPSSSQNKGKIVKSVFGRALTGEKVDKVKEVLDDWVSRSDSESRDDARPSSHTNTWNNWKDGRKSKLEKSRSKSTSQRKKNNSSTVSATVTSSTEFNELSGNSRCRQSKKRAEERISRAFEEESVPYEFAYELEQQTESIKSYKASTIYNNELPDDSLKSVSSKKSRDKIDNDFINKIHEESEKSNSDVETSRPEEFLFPDTNSMESIRTRVPSCPRERSSTPDMVSLTTRDSDNDVENGTDMDNDDDNEDEDNNENDNDNDDGEDDEDIVRGRLSPLYASNLAESSVDSVVSNSNEDTSNRDECIETTNKRRSSSEFSGEKIVIRSTVSSEESHAGVVTIAPTDAIEDNALDVPQETEESTQKSRQGKVLNFDEELFVECCSRLKATTENELRGAKKIKLDHNEGSGGGSAGSYHGKDDQGMRTNRGRWRDTENQNSLGSLLESVNQLLGEEMYNNREHHKRERNSRCERISPVTKVQTDFIRPENVGYEDSLDVAFEHNNKLRDKIQQRMRESENLITASFSHVSNDNVINDDRHRSHHHHHHHHHHRHQRHHENIYNSNQREHNERMFDDSERGIENMKDADQLSRHVSLESSTIKNKVVSNLDKNSTMPYLLDKALSSLFHNDAKHDHNGSTPMNVLAELACAQVPTSTHTDVKLLREKLSRVKTLSNDLNDSTSTIGVQQSVDKIDKDQPKKTRNPIKELFERKNEINDRKHHHEKSHSLNSHKDCATSKQKTKKTKRHNDFPLIKNNEFGSGMVERKKRRDDRKRETIMQDKIKDVYDFDEEESEIKYAVNPTIPYRRKNDKNCDEISNTKSKDITFGDLMTKTITKTLENGHSHGHTDKCLEKMIERKFHEIESVTPKTKGALKAYHVEEKRQSITGPMDVYIERRGRPRRTTEQSNKHNKSKKRSKNSKKRSRTAWYENDSSDEFVTAIKSVDIGVGISKSQRTCSKGKQNLFAELSTSSESEYEDNEAVHQLNNKIVNESRDRISPEIADNYPQEHENHSTENWLNVSSKTEMKNDIEHKKSESDMSDHPLIIDERKDCDDQQNNSDDETDNRSEPAFELDDLYREDSSVVGSDCEDNNSVLPPINEIADDRYCRDENSDKNELIPLEEALDLLDNPENISKIHDDVIESASIPQTDNLIVSDKFSESLDENEGECDEINVNGNNKNEQLDIDDEQESIELPEKLSSNEKPEPKASDNLPLHVFLSRKVQESKKRKEEQLKKLQEKEEENALIEFQSTRRQRKCAIGKQGLLAEISSSDEEYYIKDIATTTRRSTADKFDNEKSRRQKRESKEKKKERYMEKKHEQIIAKEQKAIEEEILRELELKKEYNAKDDIEMKKSDKKIRDKDNRERQASGGATIAESNNKKYQRSKKVAENSYNKDKNNKDEKFNSDTENKCNKVDGKTLGVDGAKRKVDRNSGSNSKKELHGTPTKNSKKSAKSCGKSSGSNRKSKNAHGERARSISKDDEELRTTKSWNKVEEGVGVAIGRRKRASTNQLYYWSSSSDDEEEFIQPTPVVEEEDDRQEQHGWIVGDSHKKMITMLAMEKQLKEKRRRSEDDFDSGKSKSKKHRNSTS